MKVGRNKGGHEKAFLGGSSKIRSVYHARLPFVRVSGKKF
jgi:hypothetical protein